MTVLTEGIPSNNVKILELYNKLESGSLNPSPDFQRKLVWKKQHKYQFIETILKNYPFPEVYIASVDIDVDSITSSEIVVDGQQRLSTIREYIKGTGDFEAQRKIKSFRDLSTDEKKSFLNYPVSVKDLKNIDRQTITDIFTRINNTEYSLNAIEKNNAIYGDGEFIVFCKQLIDQEFTADPEMTDCIIEPEEKQKINDFFNANQIFSENDNKRMVSLQFVMNLIATLVDGTYFNRNTRLMHYIENYNGSFPDKSDVEEKILRAINFYEHFGFEPNSYWLNKSNVFTLIVELSAYEITEINISKFMTELKVIEDVASTYQAQNDNAGSEESRYVGFIQQGVNERAARSFRGDLIKSYLERSKVTK
jgi:hypothetical protein